MEIVFDTIHKTPSVNKKYKQHFTLWRNFKASEIGERFHLVVNGIVVGACNLLVLHYRDVVKIHCLEIFTPHRNNGYGKLFLQEIDKWSKDNGIVKVVLDVEPENEIAYRLYIDYGFKLEIIRHDGDHTMIKNLQ